MKREAINHTKMKRLCHILDAPLFHGVGLLELLWHTTARQAPRGDIGRLRDGDIMLAMDYSDDAKFLIDALVDAGWLDRNDEHRLIVHHWPDHAEHGVHMKIARARQFFVSGDPENSKTTLLVAPRLTNLPARDRALAEEFYRGHSVDTAWPLHEGLINAEQLHGQSFPMFENEHFVAGNEVNGKTVDTAWTRRGSGGSGPRLDPALTEESSGSLKDSQQQQHRRPDARTDDDAVLNFAAEVQKLAGLKRLSKADGDFCRELHAAGVTVEIVRAGIAAGKVRRFMHETRKPTPDRISSLRYFEGPIEEARQNVFGPDYARHCEEWLERRERENGNKT